MKALDYILLSLSVTIIMFFVPVQLHAQNTKTLSQQVVSDKIKSDTLHSTSELLSKSIQKQAIDSSLVAQKKVAKRKEKRNWATWKPETKRALWLSLVLPGAGQIYNRKYWKLPIIYGGFVGCAYAMRWNNMMYRDYSQAYLDIMDNDPQTQSYNQFLHLGTTINEANAQRWQEIFRKRKDRYRRWRDMSFFAMVGIYALSVIDAYVDASLSEFDISSDLSMRVSPTVFNNPTEQNPFKGNAIGLQCSINF